MSSASDFLKWCSVFKIPLNGGGGSGNTDKQIIFTSAAFNAKTAGAVPLFTTTNNVFDFLIPDELILIPSLVSSAVGPTALSVGSNDSDYDNLLSIYDFSSLNATGNGQAVPLGNTQWLTGGAVGTELQANITGVAVGTSFSAIIILKCIGVNIS